MQLHVLEPLGKLFYTFVCEHFSSCRLKFPGENCRQIYGEFKARVWGTLSTVTHVVRSALQYSACRIICVTVTIPNLIVKSFVALVYNSYFFRTAVLRKLFDIRFSYKHCNAWFNLTCYYPPETSQAGLRARELFEAVLSRG